MPPATAPTPPMLDASALTRVRLLVVGDVMLDRYWFGEVERISPEAPVPVVRIGKTEERLGGAANVARNVTATMITPNRAELREVVGRWRDEADLERRAQSLRADLGLQALLLTRS